MSDRIQNRTALVGVILIVFGVLFLAAQLFNVPWFRYGWPLIFAAIGILFLLGAVAGPRGSGGMAIPGTMLIVLACVFLFQAWTGYWASWAYAWALIAPAGVGLGMLVWNRIEPHAGLEIGRLLVAIGLLIFVVLGAFFEMFVFLIGAPSPGRLLWPVGLIVVGLLILFSRSMFRGWFPGPARPTMIVNQTPAQPAPTISLNQPPASPAPTVTFDRAPAPAADLPDRASTEER
jgi:hypothetical protein